MGKILFSIVLMISILYGNESLFYKIQKGSKTLGYYEIDYKNSMILSKGYGGANQISYFADKKIEYISDGFSTYIFKKHKKVVKFKLYSKVDALDSSLSKKYSRKIRKVKNNNMLLLIKDQKKSIELFNKRKTLVLTLDEVLKLVSTSDFKEKKFILFDKSGVMKMIAKLVKVSDGYDIINRSKSTKYAHITIQNNKPIKISSYVADWSMVLEKYGQSKLKKVSKNKMDNVIINYIQNNLRNDGKLLDIVTNKFKGKNFYISYKASIEYKDRVANKKPKNILPESPMNIFAG